MSHSVEDLQKMREGGNRIVRTLVVLALVAGGVWWQFIRLPQGVEITNMVAGLNPAMSGLECWVTLEFNDAPDRDHRKLVVVFEGEAVRGGEQRFDWRYIAEHDVTAGADRRNNEATVPTDAPAIGSATKVRFPIDARARVDDASYNMPLVATVYWGGEKQDSAQRSVGHAYRGEGAPL